MKIKLHPILRRVAALQDEINQRMNTLETLMGSERFRTVLKDLEEKDQDAYIGYYTETYEDFYDFTQSLIS
jgi:hypothetical protein